MSKVAEVETLKNALLQEDYTELNRESVLLLLAALADAIKEQDKRLTDIERNQSSQLPLRAPRPSGRQE